MLRTSPGPSPAQPIVDVTQMIEDQRVGAFAFGLLALTFLCMLLDGFDFAGVSYVVPALAKEWNVDVGSFGSVLGVGVFGLMVGSLAFGYVGDRIGRKMTIVVGCCWFGIFVLASAWAPNVTVLIGLRFLSGVGLYAAVPNAIVLVSEFAPKRFKARWVVLMFTGFTVGSVVAGLTAASLMPIFGWRVMFWLGGILPFVVAAVLYVALPESVRFLTLRPERWGELAIVLGCMRPGFIPPPNARYEVHDEQKRRGKFSYKLLFVGPLVLITPLLWLFYSFNSVATFFTTGWLPTLMQAEGLSPSQAALTTALNALGGTIGGLVTGVIIDQLGLEAVAVLPLLGGLISLVIGYQTPVFVLEALVFSQGFFVVGTQFACTALAPMLYPTAYRANGEGTALAVAKIGSIAGPVLGGILISMALPVHQLFYVAAVPLFFSAIISFWLGRAVKRARAEEARGIEDAAVEVDTYRPAAAA